MSIDRDDILDGIRVDAMQLLARAAAAESRADAGAGAVAAQLAVPAAYRIDDRMRARIMDGLSAMVAAIENDIRRDAGRALALRGAMDLADAVILPRGGVERLLHVSGVLALADLSRELLARAGQEMIGEGLPITAPDDDDSASLIVQLTAAPDAIVAAKAVAYLAAEAVRRAPGEGRAPLAADLPAELHHCLVWRVTAAIAAQLPAIAASARSATDRALTDAALRTLAAHDEGARVEAAAMQLAAAIDARTDELPDLAVEALRDRHLPLFIAILAHAAGLDYDIVRDMVLDPAGERLWVVARALDLPRDTIARIGLSLCEGDPQRDLDRFADQLDVIAAIPADEARLALTPLRRHPEFRAAARAIARGDGA